MKKRLRIRGFPATFSGESISEHAFRAERLKRAIRLVPRGVLPKRGFWRGFSSGEGGIFHFVAAQREEEGVHIEIEALHT